MYTCSISMSTNMSTFSISIYAYMSTFSLSMSTYMSTFSISIYAYMSTWSLSMSTYMSSFSISIHLTILSSWNVGFTIEPRSPPIHNRLPVSFCFTKRFCQFGGSRDWDRFMGSGANIFFQRNRLRQWTTHGGSNSRCSARFSLFAQDCRALAVLGCVGCNICTGLS